MARSALGRQLGATRAGRQSEGRCYARWSNFGRFPEVFFPSRQVERLSVRKVSLGT